MWWNGGVAVGYIQSIVDTDAAIAKLGVDNKGILISSVKGRWEGRPLAYYPEASFDDDGIGLLTGEELDRLQGLQADFRRLTGWGSDERLAITREFSNGILVRWVFVGYSTDGHMSWELSPDGGLVRQIDAVGVQVLYKQQPPA